MTQTRKQHFFKLFPLKQSSSTSLEFFDWVWEFIEAEKVISFHEGQTDAWNATAKMMDSKTKDPCPETCSACGSDNLITKVTDDTVLTICLDCGLEE